MLFSDRLLEARPPSLNGRIASLKKRPAFLKRQKPFPEAVDEQNPPQNSDND